MRKKKREQVLHTLRVLIFGTVKRTSPPPFGATPRASIFSSKSSAGTPKRFMIFKVVERNVSTLASLGSFVIPLSLIERGFFPNNPNKSNGSR
jgi:hypothetical protein